MSIPVCQTGVAKAIGFHLTPAQSFVRINGALVTIQDTPIEPHGGGIHANALTDNAVSITRIDGVPVCRNGEVATCGHPNTDGASWVRSD